MGAVGVPFVLGLAGRALGIPETVANGVTVLVSLIGLGAAIWYAAFGEARGCRHRARALGSRAMNTRALGIALAVIVALGSVAFTMWWRGQEDRATGDTAKALAAERERSWHATVTRTEIQEFGSQGPARFGTIGKLKHLTVYYRRDDGTEGNVQAYEHDAMRSTYTGPLAYYKKAPGWDELSRWKKGDRLVKPVGQIFPQREQP